MKRNLKTKTQMKRPLGYFKDSGPGMKKYPLILAVYYDRYEKAKDILKADPDQLNQKDPYAGLTALHIAIFRQNIAIIELLLAQPGINLEIKDNFGRRPVDMLDYTVNQEIFELIMDATYPDEMRALEDEEFEEGIEAGNIVPFKPNGP